MKIVPVVTVIVLVGLGVMSGRGVLQAGGSRFTIIDDPNGMVSTVASGINAQGDIVGYYTDSIGTYYGFLRHQGHFTTIDGPEGAKGTVASGINAQGDIVGYYTDSIGNDHGWIRQTSP